MRNPAVTSSPAADETLFTASARLGSLAGIEIRADASLLIIFVLVLFSLGAGVFPAWHPEWGAGTTWLTALGAAVLLFASILVHELMLAPVDTVSPGTPLEELVEQHIMRSDQRVFPVLDSGRLVGMVGIEDARAVPRDSRSSRRVAEVMTPAERLPAVSPAEDSADALRKLRRFASLPVVERGELRGLLRREDVAKWLLLRGDTPLPG